MNLKYLENKALEKNKILFIESSNFATEFVEQNLVIFKEKKLFEAKGKNFEALAVIKNVPISKFTKNSNGRVYPKALWERIYRSRIAEGNLALADHPIEEGSVTSVWGVWHEMRVTDSDVRADLYLIEEKPLKILKAGGRLGTSSVGFGELDPVDNCTVLVESYELERLADIVLTPSQGTYFESSLISKETPYLESGPLEDTIKIKKEDTNIMDKKFMELNAQNHVKSKLREAKKSENYTEALELLNEAKDYVAKLEESPMIAQLVTQLDSGISEIQLKIDEKAKLQESKIVSVEASHRELTEKYNKLQEDHEKVLKILEIAKEEAEEKKALEEDLANAIDDVNIFLEDTEARDQDIAQFKVERKIMKEDIDKLTKLIKEKDEEIDLRESDFVIFKEERKTLMADVKRLVSILEKAKKRIVFYEKELEKRGFEFEDATKPTKKKVVESVKKPIPKKNIPSAAPPDSPL
jgi:predicted Zn-ribbon and HTH transcriptional regulator